MKTKEAALPHERLTAILHYDQDTGIFTWKVSGRRGWAGKRAGTPQSRGYVAIKIGPAVYLAHRLAWFYVHGEWPPKVDHRDTDRTNNAIANLRRATASQNGANMRMRPNNRVGLKGVCLDKRVKRGKCWQAQVTKDGRMRNLGRFDTPEEAHAAYVKEAEKLFGEFARAA